MNRDFFDKMQKITKPMRDLERITNSIPRMIPNIRKDFTRAMEIQNSFSRIQELINPISDLHKVLEKFNLSNRPWEQYALAHQSIITGFNRLNEETPENLLLLAHHGWYLDFQSELGLPLELGELLREGQMERVDGQLIEYYSTHLENILNRLIYNHPTREKILKGIFDAHKVGNYAVSIPTIFSQVDGICLDLTKKKFFIKNNKKSDIYLFKPEITHALTDVSEGILKSFVSPIFKDLPITARTQELANFPISLNRHAIIHGEDVEYDTELNALKCISLLTYVSDVLIEVLSEQNN